MKILVCLKQILDPDLPARDFKINPETKEADPGGANLVTNIFCENALETALQLKESAGDATVTALCYGGEKAEDSLRKALAMTADEAILVSREGSTNPDAETVAKILAAAVRHKGGFDLILVGRESGDWGVGQTGGLLAEELEIGALGFVESLSPREGGVEMRRQTDAGIEVAHAGFPVLATITNNEANVPRIPKTRDVMMSYRKPLEKLSLADLGSDDDATRQADGYYGVEELYVPEKDVQCEFAEGDSIDEKVDAFASRIAEVVAAAG